MLRKVLNKIAVFSVLVLVCVGTFPPVYGTGDAKNCVENVYASLQGYERTAISELAKHFGLDEADLGAVLVFKASEKSKFFDKKCCLVPVCDCREHINCFLRVFSYANPEYMRYYLNGKIKSPTEVEAWVKRAVRNISVDSPNSVTFLVKVGDDFVGRIGIGPLANRGKTEMEIGYAIEEAYSGQGIMGKAVGKALSFLKLLRERSKDCYDFVRLRATAKFGNEASNRLLRSKGFILSDSPVDDGCGPENEYYYYFDI